MSGRVGVCGSLNMDVFGYARRLPAPGETVLGDRLVAALDADGIIVDEAGENQILALYGANHRATAPEPEPAVDVWVTQGEVPPDTVAGCWPPPGRRAPQRSSRRHRGPA